MLAVSMAGAIALAATSLASCSVADAELAANEPQPSRQHDETIRKTRSTTEAYGYSSSDEMRQASAGDNAIEMPQARETKTAYLGSAPYICSPSGFGQKSRCFLR
ncbi:hypothetical protein ACO34A_04950 [Rhizobium sp. ACO-34A]|nr:hypothetical protein ACO34A_04950 [Rhizobium sp. ACO-34A]